MLNYLMRVTPARLYSDVGSFRFLVPIVLLCQLLNYVYANVMQCKYLKIFQRPHSPVRDNSLAAYQIN